MEETYKIIIIGAGMTGLSTGLAWAKIFPLESNPALIIEKNNTVGGCVSTFSRAGFRFDTVQIIPDVSDILRFFDINVELQKFDRYYARLFLADPVGKKARIFPIASDMESFEKDLTGRFPGDGKRIRRFFEYCSSMYKELNALKTEPKARDIIHILLKCPKILANSGKTYKQFLRRFHFENPDLVEILDTFSSFSGLSGNRCAALLTACAMITTLHGSYRPAGGFIQFPVLLKKEFEKRGGKVLLRTAVKRILVENGKAAGVELEDGRKIKASYVVSTADTQVTLGRMIGYDSLKKIDASYADKAQKASMSPSAFAIHLGLDDHIDLETLGFDCGYNVLTTGRQTHEKMFDDWEKGELHLSDDAFHLAVIAPSVMTGGKPSLIIHVVPVPASYWIRLRNSDYEKYRQEKNQTAEFYIRKTEEYMIPGLRKHIRFMDVSTPATYARYIHSPTGSNYDMMPVPGNFGKNRLKTRTPVKNLFLPKFSHGIWPSMQAGLQVVDMLSSGKIMQGNSSYKEKP